MIIMGFPQNKAIGLGIAHRLYPAGPIHIDLRVPERGLYFRFAWDEGHGLDVRGRTVRLANELFSIAQLSELFSWLHDWERFMAIKFEPSDAMDADFIRRITQSSDELYPEAKSTALEYYGSAERTEPEWVGILRSTSPNHAMFINMFKTKEGFGLPATAHSAVVNIPKLQVSSQDDLIDQNVVDNIQTVISTFDQGQKNLLGTDIRTLIYSADTINRKPPVADPESERREPTDSPES